MYDGDHFSTDEGGALRLRCKAALLDLAEKSAVLVHRAGNETEDAEAKLLAGTSDFSAARAGEFEIAAQEAHIRPAGNGRTAAQVSVIGPKKLHLYARRGMLLFSYRGGSKTIAEESFEVMLDPPEDGSDKKQSAQEPGQPPKAFLLVAGGGGAAAAAVILYEKHKHKDVESPDHP